MPVDKERLTPPLGIFGGTFDPIHNGHLFPVLEAAQITNIQKIAMMPCYLPSHKDPAMASSAHRLAMVEEVCSDYPVFYPEPRDIIRNKPTYTLDSLQEFREALPSTPLCFFIGTDSLQSIFSWHKWQSLFNLCHFIVCKRQDDSVDTLLKHPEHQAQLQALLDERQTTDPNVLHNHLAGHIYIAQTQTVTVSSSHVRRLMSQNQSVEALLPPKIYQYIQKHQLYRLAPNF